jgi:transposase
MHAVTTIGLDIAKSVIQVHGVDAHGNVAVRRRLERRQVLPFFKKLPPALWVSRPPPRLPPNKAARPVRGLQYP